MNKPWLGYLSSALLLFAGILMIADNKKIIGIVFILLSITSTILNIFMYRKKN
ncbi:MAG: hypothetical protein ACXVC7_12930 [Bacteroidia bacterium]